MTGDFSDFTHAELSELGYYVYLYIDPDSGAPFYVGKGVRNRVGHHRSDRGGHPLAERLKAIRSRGAEPRIEILAYGLDEATAYKVEAAAIDLIGFDNLTNRQIGRKAAQFGRQSIEAIRARLAQHPIRRFEDNCLAIRIDKSLRDARDRLGTQFDGASDELRLALYDCVRGTWPVNIDRVADYPIVLTVNQGVVREVYRVAAWLPAGSTLYFDPERERISGRYEFVGAIAEPVVRARYHLKVLTFPRGDQFPVRYFESGHTIAR